MARDVEIETRELIFHQEFPSPVAKELMKNYPKIEGMISTFHEPGHL